MGTRIPNRYRIVIALDGSEYSEIVLEHALDQAARHDSPDLHVLAVVEMHADLQATKDWLARTVLEGLESFRGNRPDWRTRLHVRGAHRGHIADEISSLVGEVDADLLVIGRYGIHHPRHSIADEVIAAVTCPALVVGLTGHELDAQPQCPACMKVRADSDGERWFCDRHMDTDRVRLSTLVPYSLPLTHGGPLW